MAIFIIRKRPHDEGSPPKAVEVELCLGDSGRADDGAPSLTPRCATEKEVEIQFEHVISEIKKKKSEALAIIRNSVQARKA